MASGESKISKIRSRQYSLATAKDFTKELVAATPTTRNWKGILIALLVICAVCGLILFSIYLLRPPDDGPRVKGRKITLADITSKHFTVEPFNGSWISDNELLFRDYLGGLSTLNVETFISRPFVANTTFRQLNAQIYSVSSDQRFILFVHDDHPVWTHSYLAKYTVYDIQNEFQVPLSPFDDTNRDVEQPELQYATWCGRGNGLLFVYQNDVYYKASPKSPTTRVTKTGKPGVVFNGIPDFIYEERILESQSALWPSPDGQKLLFASFNDSLVGEYVYNEFGNPDPYPTVKTLRYPKTGTVNPTAKLWAVNINNSLKPIPVTPPSQVEASEHYLVNVRWIDNSSAVVTWMNRKQTASIISKCRPTTGLCEEVRTVKTDATGWLDFIAPPLFSTNGSTCLYLAPRRDGEAGLFRHVVWLDIKSGRTIPITHGPYEVTAIVAWDQINHFIYYIAAPQGKAGQRHLFRAAEKSTNSTVILSPVCLTCPIASSTGRGNDSLEKEDPDESSVLYPYQHPFYVMSDGSSSSSSLPQSTSNNSSRSNNKNNNNSSSSSTSTSVPLWRQPPCLYNNVIFSPNHKYFVRECLGPGVPTVTLHSAPSGRLLFILNNNTMLQEEVAGMGLPLVRTFEVEVSGGYHAPVRLFLPPGLREDEEFKFPFVLHVYGGPGSQLVSEKWGLSWASYLTSQKNFIVAQIDGRGTGFQGDNVRHSIYRKLGTFDVTDQLEVIQYLKDHLSFIDVENMAIWGQSYGGYVAALILAHDTTKLFRCGISVSPVTKFEYYDTVYTERYMGMPNFSDNYRGYEQADITRKEIVEKLRDRKFLIIHGTADERVHFQHTLHFTKELINRGITFKEQIYPDEGHDLKGVQDHLYGTMEMFIDSSFDPIDFEDWEKANFLGIKM